MPARARLPAVPAWAVMGVLLALMGALIAYQTRGTTLWLDEWAWVRERRGGGLDDLLRSHNGHLSLVPVAVYKVLFATAGLDSYWPYRLAVIVAHLTVCALVYVYAARRVGGWGAVVAAVLVLVLGPAWQDLLWPFQVGFLTSLAAGVGALVLLDRRDRIGDAGACALVAVALASSGLGVPIAAGVAVELALSRRWRSAWVVLAPLAVYALWFAFFRGVYGRTTLGTAPLFAADAAAGTFSALLGLTGGGIEQEARSLQWGRPLAVVAIALLVWRIRQLGGASARVLGLVTVAAAFWLLTGVQRGFIGSPTASRYLYVGALVIVLVAVELLRGVRFSPGARLAVAGAAVLVVVANLTVLAEAGRFMRLEGARTRATLGALDIARPVAPPDAAAEELSGYPLVVLPAASYFALTEELGRAAVADTPGTLVSAPEVARRGADAELLRLHGGPLRPPDAVAGAGAPPAIARSAGGTVTTEAGCVTFRAAGAVTEGTVSEVEVVVPPGGVVVRPRGGDVAVGVRRFAAAYPDDPQARIRAGARAAVRFLPDRAEQPWRLRLAPEAAVAVCGGDGARAAQG